MMLVGLVWLSDSHFPTVEVEKRVDSILQKITVR